MSYSKALEYWVKLILQPIYQLGKLYPCSQTWSKCQQRHSEKQSLLFKSCCRVSTLPASERVLHCNWRVLQDFLSCEKFQVSRKDMPFLLLGGTFEHSYIPSLGYTLVWRSIKIIFLWAKGQYSSHISFYKLCHSHSKKFHFHQCFFYPSRLFPQEMEC